jgi:Protein of unknown function (DUF2892)
MPAMFGQRQGANMLYRKNVGSKEALARVLGGAAIVAFSLAGIGTTPLGLMLAAGGVMAILTGLFGYCPACALIGRKPLDGAS